MSETEVKNFDQLHPENRSFILGGQTFHWNPLHWREFGEMVEEAVVAADEEAKLEQEAEKARERGEEPPKTLTIVDSYEQLIDRVCKYLEPSEVENFRAIVNDPMKRVSHLQLSELRNWLQEVSNNRPTEQPSPSDAGLGSDAPTLRAVSP